MDSRITMDANRANRQESCEILPWEITNPGLGSLHDSAFNDIACYSAGIRTFSSDIPEYPDG